MNPLSQKTSPASSTPILALGALASAVFFMGENYIPFTLALALLLLWVAAPLWNGAGTVHLPVSPLAFALTLFWGWLALTLLWSSVPYLSVLSFWWMGALPLAFWGFSLSPSRDRLWESILLGLAVMGIALSSLAIYQALAHGDLPQATFLNKNSLAGFFNLILLPLAATLLQRGRGETRKKSLIVSAASVVMMALATGLTGSRGALIGLFLGLALLLGHALLQRRTPIKILLVLTLVGLGLFLGNLHAPGYGRLSSRVVSMANPQGDGAMMERLLIWKASGELIRQAPLQGHGLGTFFLLYPPVRDVRDRSAGQHVHNDYLEIWLEVGLPALLLLMAAGLSVAALYARAQRTAHLDPDRKLEASGVGGAMLALASHSFFTFNLYIFPTLLLTGLLLGRLQHLSGFEKHLSLAPGRIFRPAVFRLLLVLLLLLPLTYLFALGWSTLEVEQAGRFLAKRDLAQASGKLSRAHRLWPASDGAWFLHADLLRGALAATPKDDLATRRKLFQRAERYLEAAEDRNPLRAEVPTIRADLWRENPDLAGPDSVNHLEAEYRRALALDPTTARARSALARTLLARGDAKAARELLEEGRPLYYHLSPEVLAFYELLAQVRESQGEPEGAADIRRQVEQWR